MSRGTLILAASQIRSDADVLEDIGHIDGRQCDFYLAVADWLDREVEEHDRYVSQAIKNNSVRTAYANDRAHHALAVARAYLGEA